MRLPRVRDNLTAGHHAQAAKTDEAHYAKFQTEALMVRRNAARVILGSDAKESSKAMFRGELAKIEAVLRDRGVDLDDAPPSLEEALRDLGARPRRSLG